MSSLTEKNSQCRVYVKVINCESVTWYILQSSRCHKDKGLSVGGDGWRGKEGCVLICMCGHRIECDKVFYMHLCLTPRDQTDRGSRQNTKTFFLLKSK